MPNGIDALNAGSTTSLEASLSARPSQQRPTDQRNALVRALFTGNRAADVLSLAFIIATTLIYFWRFIDPWSQQPSFFPPGDLTEQFYPYHYYAIAELADGRLPIWSPYANAGRPFIGDIQTAVFYPPKLLLAYALIAIGQSELSFPVFEWLIIVHYVVAAVGLFVFVRSLTASRIAALAAATAFTFGGLLTSYPPLQTAVLQSMVWLPYTLLFLRQAFIRRRSFYLLPAAASLCLSALGGHPQTTAFHFYLAAVYGMYQILAARATKRGAKGCGLGAGTSFPGARASSPTMAEAGEDAYGPREETRTTRTRVRWALPGIVLLALTFCLALALTAEQLLPTMELWQLSWRATTDYVFGQAGFPAWQSIGILLPAAVGSYPMSVGFFAFLLALLALARLRNQEVLFWVITAILTYVLSFGGLTPLYAVARTVVPGYGLFRGQERIIYLTSFVLAVLVGYGVTWLLSHGPGDRWKRIMLALSPLGLLAAGLAVCSPDARISLLSPEGTPVGFSPPVVQVAFVALVSSAVLWLTSGLYAAGCAPLRRAYLAPGLIALLLPILTSTDNLSATWNSLVADSFPQAPTPVVDYLREEATDGRIDHNGSMPFSGFYYRLPFLRSDAQLEDHDFQSTLDELGFYSSAQLFGQRYAVTTSDAAEAELLFRWQELRVYRLPSMPGRLNVVYRLQTVPDASEQLRVMKARIAERDFAFGRDAIVDETALTTAAGGAFTNAASLLDLKPTELLAQVDTTAPGMLVLSDMYYPGWHAYLDGLEVPIRRANFAVRGVDLPAGPHLVGFRYSPSWLYIGLGICTLGLTVLLLLVARAAACAGPGSSSRLPRALRQALHLGIWLIPVVGLGIAAILATGAFALRAPTIPAVLHDAGQWKAAADWAGDQCTGTIVPPGSPLDNQQSSGTAYYRSWDAIAEPSGAAVSRVCVLVDRSGASRAEDLEPPPGWQKAQVRWFGTIWGALYLRQEWMLSEIPFRQVSSLGQDIDILGFAWTGAVSAGDSLRLHANAWPPTMELFMRATRATPIEYRVFVQLLDSSGRAVSISDHQPRGGARPTSTWPAGDIMKDQHQLARPQTPEAGAYLLIAGVYDEKTKTRLRTVDGQDHVVLARVEVQ